MRRRAPGARVRRWRAGADVKGKREDLRRGGPAFFPAELWRGGAVAPKQEERGKTEDEAARLRSCGTTARSGQDLGTWNLELETWNLPRRARAMARRVLLAQARRWKRSGGAEGCRAGPWSVPRSAGGGDPPSPPGLWRDKGVRVPAFVQLPSPSRQSRALTRQVGTTSRRGRDVRRQRTDGGGWLTGGVQHASLCSCGH